MDIKGKKTQEILEQLQAKPAFGLSELQVHKNQQKFGENKLKEQKKKSILIRFFMQLSDFMVLILIAAAGVSIIISYIDGKADFLDPIIVLGIVVLNAIIGLVQESKSEHALEALKALSAPMAKVRREGKVFLVPSSEITVGDVLLLEAGDYVAADSIIISAINLASDEAALTGESVPVEKTTSKLIERENTVFASCAITCGRGEAVVISTGMNTEVGKIADLLTSGEAPDTPLQKRLVKAGKAMGIGAIVICGIIFALGLMQNVPALEMLMVSVSLAVAAIPEGLPAVVTIVLAMGLQKMAQSNAIVRRLPAVETLGCATVICSDKTGTLTENRMTVVSACTMNGAIELSSAQAKKLLEMSALCNNANLSGSGALAKVTGEPTEAALLMAANKAGIKTSISNNNFPRINEIPFNSTRKLMSTLHKLPDGKVRVLTKGAPDFLIKQCAFYFEEKVLPLSSIEVKKIMVQNEAMADKAQRVLAVAYKDIDQAPTAQELHQIEKDLIFVGLIGMIDPPRAEAANAVELCRRAGIKVVMITGDHSLTAKAIAKTLGILGNKEVLSGAELARLSDHQLNKAINKYSVFARVTPEDKVRIVKAFQANREIVAMTGDGVNDAPALKMADIGCAMGKGGTEVAKGAADIVLTDDNFATIVEAVRQGRGIYDNIKRAIHFLLSSNIGEIISILGAFLMGLPSPLIAIQLLWVNLVTDSLPALALGTEATAKDIMQRKPIDPKKGIFSDGLVFYIITEGFMIGLLALCAFSIGRFISPNNTLELPRTMAFCVLSLSQLVHSFNMRSDHSVFSIGVFSNKKLVLACLFCAFLQISVVMFAPLAAIFKTAQLSLNQWLIVAGLSLVPLLVCEVQKAFSVKGKKMVSEVLRGRSSN